MLTYTTLDGRVLDLGGLTAEERLHFDRAYAAYAAAMPVADFNRGFVFGQESPLLRATGGWVTRAVWDHPLFQAVYDLGDRLGIRQGELAPEGDLERDPLDDYWLPAPDAARRKGVTLPGLHAAIRRGAVLARPATAGGARLVVSARSLERWNPNPARQRAGRAAAGRRR